MGFRVAHRQVALIGIALEPAFARQNPDHGLEILDRHQGVLGMVVVRFLDRRGGPGRDDGDRDRGGKKEGAKFHGGNHPGGDTQSTIAAPVGSG